MTLVSHISSLNERHEELEQEIQYATIHHLPVGDLKKKKLKIKDEIEGLKKVNNFTPMAAKEVVAA